MLAARLNYPEPTIGAYTGKYPPYGEWPLEESLQEAYNPLEDIASMVPWRRLASSLFPLALASFMPQSPLAAYMLGRTKKELAPAAWRAAERIGARKGAIAPEHVPLKDVPVYALNPFRKSSPLLVQADLSKAGQANLDPNDPWMWFKAGPGILEGQAQGIATHEVTHFIPPQLKRSTVEQLRKSFLRRKDTIRSQMLETGNYTEDRVDKILNYLSYHPDPYIAVQEILAHALQGAWTPTGPERHLLSKYGREMAAQRFPRIPEINEAATAQVRESANRTLDKISKMPTSPADQSELGNLELYIANKTAEYKQAIK
jgi:hypothetical protein